MIYVHENNLKTKIKDDYKNKDNIGIGSKIKTFYDTKYITLKTKLLSYTFDKKNITKYIDSFTDDISQYYADLKQFAIDNKIDAHSKFESTFLEEISCYLFKDLKEIKTGKFDIFNKGIYAGMKINNDDSIEIIKKDVDFCIGKKTKITIGSQPEEDLIIPIIAVEVKTYLDATMFGEVKSSSKDIRSSSPMSKTYVLMGYKNIKNDHILAAKQDSTITQMFVMKKNKKSTRFDSSTLLEYWIEISEAVKNALIKEKIKTPGKLFNR